MYNSYNITITYTNPYNVDFKFFKNYFELRLKFENATTYIYRDRILIFKRKGNDNNRSDFENSILRANNFIASAKVVEGFIKYNNPDL